MISNIAVFIFLSLCKYGHHIHQTTGHQPCMVANPARGRLKRGNESSPVPVGAGKFSLARQVRSSRPASACSSSTHRLNPALTRELLSSLRLSATAFIYVINRHQVSPKLVRARNCVPMTFTIESPPAQGP